MTVARRRTSIAAVALSLTLGLAACSEGDLNTPGEDPADAVSTPTETTMEEPTDAPTDMATEEPAATPDPDETGADDGATGGTDGAAAAGAPFGPGCDMLEQGAEGLEGAADDTVTDAVRANPELAVLLGAVEASGLTDQLNDTDGLTVFAPTNDAFAALDPTELAGLLTDPRGDLAQVLSYHIVPQQVSPAELGGSYDTLQGSQLTVEGSGEDFAVNGTADVVCGGIETANATVYVIDEVLQP